VLTRVPLPLVVADFWPAPLLVVPQTGGGTVRPPTIDVADVVDLGVALGAVYPYVHAKLMSVDSAVCAIGSANLDATSSYWETELLLVIEDPVATGRLEARLNDLVATATRVDRSDPAWRERARRRSWMRRWPGVLEV
jgi:phosphatidylserine/phosphatidylglycerophosphate/cardiolipin synthase-like enzyme